MPSSRPVDRFNDIIDNIDAISAYTASMDEEQFIADRKTYDATERCLARISAGCGTTIPTSTRHRSGRPSPPISRH